MDVLLCMFCSVNIIPVDALVANANRASAGVMLTQELINIPTTTMGVI